jgi:2-polyprenyl-6-methoxyphenol hydroxylase-like FAD-dependent oxidoreductase
MSPRHAEIAGGGIAGMGLATMLANNGWSVRVHERRGEISEVGAGIYLRNTPLSILDKLGVKESLRSYATPIARSLWRTGKGKVIRDDDITGAESLEWVLPREKLMDALVVAVERAGVEIVNNSKVASADPNGQLILSDGSRCEADLVVAADGHASVIRDQLGLTTRHEFLPTKVTRFLIPNRDFLPDDTTTMYWSGNRRVGVAACGDLTYVYLTMPESDKSAIKQPIDLPSWQQHFPVLAPLLAKVADLPSIQHNYAVAQCSAWTRGKIAIVGDAAHGLPPILGQGAGLALSNTWALSTALNESSAPVPEVLQAWESKYRVFADKTQLWSLRMDSLTRTWPRLLPGRTSALRFIGGNPRIQREMNMANYFSHSVAGLSA